MIYKGTIRRLIATRESGLAILVIDDERKGRVSISCENAPTVRALDACFGSVIGEGHTYNHEAIAGKAIYYGVTEYGLLLAFAPVEGASPDLVAEYEAAAMEKPGCTFRGFLPPDDPIYSGGPIVAGREIGKPKSRRFSENN